MCIDFSFWYYLLYYIYFVRYIRVKLGAVFSRYVVAKCDNSYVFEIYWHSHSPLSYLAHSPFNFSLSLVYLPMYLYFKIYQESKICVSSIKRYMLSQLSSLACFVHICIYILEDIWYQRYVYLTWYLKGGSITTN